MSFFSDQTKFEFKTLEEENEGKVPRDRWDRPLIWLPDLSKREPYARASSYGGKLEDKTNLEKWAGRQILRGAAIERSIVDRVPAAALDRSVQSEMSKRDKDTLNELVEQAKEAAGSNDKAGLGTAIHAATEYIDRGESLDGLSDLLVNRANAYYKATQEAGFRHVSVETFGVEDEHQVAGTWDRKSRASWFKRERIVDVKTSGTMDFAGIGFMVQLAEYAHMKAYELDGTRTPHEDMDEQVGIIVHVDREMDGPVEIFLVDIERGWRYAKLGREIILARRAGATKGAFSEISPEQTAIWSATTIEELHQMWADFGGPAFKQDFIAQAAQIEGRTA